MNKPIQDIKIFTFSGDLLSCDNIVRIEESFGSTFIIDTEGNKHQSVLSIDALEWEMPKSCFKRIHPKHLINQKYMVQTVNLQMEYIQLINGEQLPISKELNLHGSIKKNKGFIHRLLQQIKPLLS